MIPKKHGHQGEWINVYRWSSFIWISIYSCQMILMMGMSCFINCKWMRIFFAISHTGILYKSMVCNFKSNRIPATLSSSVAHLTCYHLVSNVRILLHFRTVLSKITTYKRCVLSYSTDHFYFLLPQIFVFGDDKFYSCSTGRNKKHKGSWLWRLNNVVLSFKVELQIIIKMTEPIFLTILRAD